MSASLHGCPVWCDGRDHHADAGVHTGPRTTVAGFDVDGPAAAVTVSAVVTDPYRDGDGYAAVAVDFPDDAVRFAADDARAFAHAVLRAADAVERAR